MLLPNTSIAACRKPVIGVINGPAVGAGVTMTLPMDIRIAADTARLGFVYARRGLVPEAASTWFLPRVVGISRAMEWVATGRVFAAEEALVGRRVSRVCLAADLLPAATAIAREICDNTTAVEVAASRQLLWSMLGPRPRGRRMPWIPRDLRAGSGRGRRRGGQLGPGKASPEVPGPGRPGLPGLPPALAAPARGPGLTTTRTAEPGWRRGVI
jgi:hypothetical protein